MTRNIFIFLGTFVVGAAVALVVRAAMFKPNAGHEGHPPDGGDYAPLVSNPLVPAAKTTAADPHANHDPAAGKPVNTVCAICGMPVDPAIPTAEYQGKTIGFGCKLCPPKFKAEPDRYGPLYLRNATVKR
jgi:hypothetical protein